MRSTMRADPRGVGARGRPAWQICLGLVLVPILTLAGGGGGSPVAVGGFVACAALGLCLVAATRMPLYQILVIVGGGQLVCWRTGGGSVSTGSTAPWTAGIGRGTMSWRRHRNLPSGLAR